MGKYLTKDEYEIISSFILFFWGFLFLLLYLEYYLRNKYTKSDKNNTLQLQHNWFRLVVSLNGRILAACLESVVLCIYCLIFIMTVLIIDSFQAQSCDIFLQKMQYVWPALNFGLFFYTRYYRKSICTFKK